MGSGGRSGATGRDHWSGVPTLAGVGEFPAWDAMESGLPQHLGAYRRGRLRNRRDDGWRVGMGGRNATENGRLSTGASGVAGEGDGMTRQRWSGNYAMAVAAIQNTGDQT